jgi:GT2 family glycosyltransferase
MKIAAVIVTFNRINLLKKCVDSIRCQTYKVDEIIVVNNSSTDGTLDWLNEQSDITTITQRNSGGAGGFHTGIKTAFEKGYDWIWCMDDDGYADENSLQKLLEFKIEEPCVLNSMVVSNIDNSKLSFSLYDREQKRGHINLADLKDYKIVKGACFFNGTLLHRYVIEQIKYPIKELYIHGDELEYYLRILKYNYEILTITDSLFYHPPALVRIYNFGIFYHYYNYVSPTKRYYRIRNLVYLSKKYHFYTFKRLIKVFVCDSLIILFKRDFDPTPKL